MPLQRNLPLQRRRRLPPASLLLLSLPCVAEPFSIPRYTYLYPQTRAYDATAAHRSVACTTTLSTFASDHQEDRGTPTRSTSTNRSAEFTAVLLGAQSMSVDEKQRMLGALRRSGYSNAIAISGQDYDASSNDESNYMYYYELSRAAGMLKLVASPTNENACEFKTNDDSPTFGAPRWVPIIRGEENVLVANGWSFLDPDGSEPMSAFDIDAANAEGLYRPKWEDGDDASVDAATTPVHTLSSLGYYIAPLVKDDILAEAATLSQYNEYSRGVLLDGQTDPPNTKLTCNGHNFQGSAEQSDVPAGIFTCAIGGLPLFASTDLAPLTGSSGWLSFLRPIANDHVILVEPEKDSMDRRVEVICSRSKCHLGHFFGPSSEGYCINASALRFVPSAKLELHTLPPASRPVAWRCLDYDHESVPSIQILLSVLKAHGQYESVALGAGCFWHVEYALRRLPGVIATEAGYAGGSKVSPTYKDVCEGNTGHAEVVKLVYDPDVVPSDVLFDCFLAMHDPTKVRAQGKHSIAGQYRSCIFVTTIEAERCARACLGRCREQLGKELGTDVRLMQPPIDAWFWRAEDRHQRHDEVVKGKGSDSLSTLSATEWLKEYGRRTPSIIGSAEAVPVGMDHPDDDGMARMMI